MIDQPFQISGNSPVSIFQGIPAKIDLLVKQIENAATFEDASLIGAQLKDLIKRNPLTAQKAAVAVEQSINKLTNLDVNKFEPNIYVLNDVLKVTSNI